MSVDEGLRRIGTGIGESNAVKTFSLEWMRFIEANTNLPEEQAELVPSSAGEFAHPDRGVTRY